MSFPERVALGRRGFYTYRASTKLTMFTMTNTSESQNFDPVKDYNDFVHDEVSLGTPTYDIPSFEEFVEMRSKLSNKDDLLKFVSPAKVGGLSGAMSVNPVIRRVLDAGVDAVSKEGQRIAADISQRLASGEAFVKVKKAFGDTGGSSGGTAGGSGSAGNPFNPNRMNFNPKPVQVRLDTGIKSKGYGDYYPESKTSLNVLELTQVEMRVPESAGSELKNYFDTVITFNFQNDAQMRVNFNVDAINKFSADNLRQWMNRYISAYGKYVWYTAIINYCNEPLQQNAGMRALRSMMTPQLLDDLSQLANMLDGTPAPPKFREFIHFVYGAPFKVSNNPGSQIRMISPSVLVSNSNVINALPANDIQTAITNMFYMRETTALIATVCPSWIPGKGNTPAGAAVCEHSPNWTTLFENLPFGMRWSGNDYYGPAVLNQDEDGVYGSMADTLDGAVTSLWNGFDAAVGEMAAINKFLPGTMVPRWTSTDDASSNRISYRFDGSTLTQQFKLVANGANQDNWMRLETYTVTNNGITHPTIWPGRELINNINVASARQTSYEFYSKMFDMGSTTNKSFDRDSKGGKRRRRGKSKASDSYIKDDLV